jgi:hypothetical protein
MDFVSIEAGVERIVAKNPPRFLRRTPLRLGKIREIAPECI